MTNANSQTSRVPQRVELNDFKLPIVISNDSDYLDNLESKLTSFLGDIRNFQNLGEEIFGRTQQNVNKILEAIKSYYDADTSAARRLIFDMLELYKDNTFIVSNLDDSPAFRGISRLRLPTDTPQPTVRHPMVNHPLSFFKARIGTEAFGKRDFLHIPFNKRGIVSTQRFSIAGVPCMYFGATSYVSWLELGKPADNEFNVSSYEVPNETKVLNLTITQQLINGLSAFGDQLSEEVASLIEIFPLIIATSYKVRENGRSFKSEYIVSQLVMQCLPLLEAEGVAYISKRVDNDSANFPVCVNLAIPMKNSSDNYSDFANQIPLTHPINYAEFKKMSIRHFQDERRASFASVIEQGISYLGRPMQYQNHEFCEFDNYLVSEQHSSVSGR
ncbi:hypothetical protein BTJ45_01155 [Bacillus mycoides]|nr:hypothetical protein BTJ45_01155 [Bacillus mycoides]